MSKSRSAMRLPESCPSVEPSTVSSSVLSVKDTGYVAQTSGHGITERTCTLLVNEWQLT